VYREQDYVERCHCTAPATTACSACGRARCERHLEQFELCNRCTQAITRELDGRSGGRWVTAGVVGTASALFLMAMQLVMIAIIGIPIGVFTFFAMRAVQRRILIQRMGPALAASKGEIQALPGEVPFDENPPPFRYY
jgi:hypothetical protein